MNRTRDSDSSLLESPKHKENWQKLETKMTSVTNKTGRPMQDNTNNRNKEREKPKPSSIFVKTQDETFAFAKLLDQYKLKANISVMTKGELEISTDSSNDYRNIRDMIIQKKRSKIRNITLFKIRWIRTMLS